MKYTVKEKKLTVQKVKALYEEVTRCISASESIQIDLQKVQYLDTSGIALILVWWQHAVIHDVICHFEINEAIAKAFQSYNIELP